nr:reverse transcriptase domain-containing protein [Tanacetum cinerariifolium]
MLHPNRLSLPQQIPSFNSIVRAFASLGHDLGTVKDKILVPKPPKNYARCTWCGYLVDGPNCQGCALLRQELEENLVTYSPDFQSTSEPSNASTNIVNAPREPYVVKQDNGSFVDKIIFDLNRAPDSPNQFHCFHCKDVLRDGEACKRCTCVKCGSDGIFCKRCTCKSCGKDAHIGYNCPSKVQSNELVERANRSLGEGIKARLGEGNKNWVVELPHVLWAHRTMIRSSHGDTPFSLTYRTEAVIPIEIRMPTYRTAVVDVYYNARVRGVTFRPGDFVYRSNDASHAVVGGKLRPKWEGPYEVTEALGYGAYKLWSMD